MRYSIKKLLIATAAIALAIWFVRSAYIGFTEVESGESVPSVSWLLAAASNVSYYRSYMNTAYEFDISESGFRSWSRWDVKEISEPVTITRYSSFANRLAEPGSNATLEEMMAYAIAASEQSATIRDGLYYATYKAMAVGYMGWL
jgi:hypothetical protein